MLYRAEAPNLDKFSIKGVPTHIFRSDGDAEGVVVINTTESIYILKGKKIKEVSPTIRCLPLDSRYRENVLNAVFESQETGVPWQLEDCK